MASNYDNQYYAGEGDSLRDELNRRWGSLKIERSTWIDHWEEIQDYILPRRGRFIGDQRNDGRKKHNLILDNTGMLAARTLASGLMAGLTSPARPWFRLTPPDPELIDSQPVKVWLGQVETIIQEIFARSNVYNALHTCYREIGGFGTAPISVVEDYRSVIRCYPFTIGSYCLDVNESLKPDTLFREIKMTSKMIVERFGLIPGTRNVDWSRISPTARNAFDRSDYHTEFTVYQAIEPNTTPLDIPNYRFMEDMDFRSIYWEEYAGRDGMSPDYLEVKGYYEQPFMGPRWDVLGTDSYGSGPGMDALGDVKQLQVQQRWKGEGISKQVNPPLVAPESLRDKYTTTIPGGITYYAQGEEAQFKPVYQVNFNMSHMLQDMEETRQRISRAFYEDLFLMLSQSSRRQITAREIEERHEEKLLMLGPVLERLEDELLDPLVDRVFNIANRVGLLPEPPEEIAEENLRVEYISILAQAQKAVALNSLERTVGFIGSVAQMDPKALDKLDTDQTIDEYAAAAGLPAEAIRSTDEVEQIRAGREDQEQQAQQVGMMGAMSTAVAPIAGLETDKRTLAADALRMAQGQGPVDTGAPV